VTSVELTHALCWTDFAAECSVDLTQPNAWKCGRCVRFPPAEKQPSTAAAPLSPAPAVKEEVQDVDDQPVFDINNVKDEPHEQQESMQTDSDENAIMDTGENVTGGVVGLSEEFIVKEEPVSFAEHNDTPLADQNGLSLANENGVGLIDNIKTEAGGESGYEEGRRSNVSYKVAMFFQRNAARFQACDSLYQIPAAERTDFLLMDSYILQGVFRYLTTFELVACRSVCQAWLRASRVRAAAAPRLDLSGMKVTAHMVQVVAVKKPQQLVLDWTNISKQQVRSVISIVYFLSVLLIRIRIRIHRNHMFLGLLDLDTDPLVRAMDPDPDPSIIKQI
jgi:hypothetical protein